MTQHSANPRNDKPPRRAKQGDSKTAFGNKQGQQKERRPPKKITESYLHNSGLYYLERFAASTNHFRTVMNRKIYRSCLHHEDQDKDKCAEMLEKTIEKFIKVELLNDEVYTKSLINGLRRKGLSQSAILTKAKIKGVPSDLAARILEEHDLTTHDSQREADIKAAIRLARKKRLGPFHQSTKELDDEGKAKLKNRQLGAMARAGYSFEISKMIFDMTQEEAEDSYYEQL